MEKYAYGRICGNLNNCCEKETPTVQLRNQVDRNRRYWRTITTNGEEGSSTCRPISHLSVLIAEAHLISSQVKPTESLIQCHWNKRMLHKSLLNNVEVESHRPRKSWARVCLFEFDFRFRRLVCSSSTFCFNPLDMTTWKGFNFQSNLITEKYLFLDIFHRKILLALTETDSHSLVSWRLCGRILPIKSTCVGYQRGTGN